MLTPTEIQHIIDYEIVVDCYDEYEMSSGWYETMNDRLNFPFKATAALTKKGGGTEAKRVTVVELHSDSDGFQGEDFRLKMELGGYVVPVKYSQLSDIEADEETMEMFEIWDFWVKQR